MTTCPRNASGTEMETVKPPKRHFHRQTLYIFWHLKRNPLHLGYTQMLVHFLSLCWRGVWLVPYLAMLTFSVLIVDLLLFLSCLQSEGPYDVILPRATANSQVMSSANSTLRAEDAYMSQNKQTAVPKDGKSGQVCIVLGIGQFSCSQRRRDWGAAGFCFSPFLPPNTLTVLLPVFLQ